MKLTEKGFIRRRYFILRRDNKVGTLVPIADQVLFCQILLDGGFAKEVTAVCLRKVEAE